MFVNDILESVRGPFAQHGKILDVFVQRLKKIWKKFHFGFVRLVEQEHVVKAINLLNGFKTGATFLSLCYGEVPNYV